MPSPCGQACFSPDSDFRDNCRPDCEVRDVEHRPSNDEGNGVGPPADKPTPVVEARPLNHPAPPVAAGVDHLNNIGLLRFCMAMSVVFGHAFLQFGPGAPAPEPLRALIPGTVPLASIGVDVFFLISGYLITQSMIRSRTLGDYMLRRVLRIYPGFIVAFLVSVLLIDACYGRYIPVEWWRLPLLQSTPLFETADGPKGANLALWTIAFEFRCYLLVALLGVTGVLDRRRVLLVALLVLLALWAIISFPPISWRIQSIHIDGLAYALLGDPYSNVRLLSTFVVGMVGYLYRDVIDRGLDRFTLCACVIWTAVMLCYPPLAELGFVVFGAPCIYWLAFKADLGRAQKLNDKWDISYGIYLYGWPVGLALSLTGLSFGLYLAATTLSVLLFGWLSWTLFERPAKDLVRHRWLVRALSRY